MSWSSRRLAIPCFLCVWHTPSERMYPTCGVCVKYSFIETIPHLGVRKEAVSE